MTKAAIRRSLQFQKSNSFSNKLASGNEDAMEGQWIGSYGGTNNGIIMLDIDDCGDHFEGRAHVFDNGLSGTVAFIRTSDRKPNQTLELQLSPLHLRPHTGQIRTSNQLSQMPDVTFPKTAKVTCELKDETLHVSWSTEIGTHGLAELPRTKSAQPSEYRPQEGIDTWSGFKSYAIKLEPGRFIFRGQDNTWRLRTAFHRTKRKDLIKFMEKDIRTLHRALSAQTKHVFNLADALQNGAFWNLIQHHGYPTVRITFCSGILRFSGRKMPKERRRVRSYF